MGVVIKDGNDGGGEGVNSNTKERHKGKGEGGWEGDGGRKGSQFFSV